VHQVCEEQGLTEQAFYAWRKRLQKQEEMRFALVETGPTGCFIPEAQIREPARVGQMQADILHEVAGTPGYGGGVRYRFTA
jgi:hypothetical protein